MLNFSSIPILVVWICVFLFLNIFGVCKKKSLFNLLTLVFSMMFLIIHICNKEYFSVMLFRNMKVDFISMIIAISLYIYVDDIESRRKVISEVFENKYKSRRKK